MPVLIGGVVVSREPFRWVSVVIDLSARRQLEAELSGALDRERAGHHRFAQVSNVVAALAAAVTPAEVVELLLERGVTASEAVAGSMHLLDRDGTTMALAASHGWPATSGPEHLRVEIAADLSLAEAIRTRRLVVVENTDQQRTTYLSDVALQIGSGSGTSVLIPVISAAQVVGVLGLIFDGQQRFSNEDQELLGTLAAAAGQALLRAQALEATASVANELQRALLPAELASHPSIQSAARYSDARCRAGRRGR